MNNGAGSNGSEPRQTSPAKQQRLRRGMIILLVLAIGVFTGLGTFTFGYGKGFSYLSSDPNACANCHVMQDHLDSWQMSSHHHVAACNDCHLPQDTFGKYVTKSDNGFFHSIAFTTGDYHDPIRIKPRNRVITQNACISCHGNFVHNMLPEKAGGEMLNCIHCHSSVGHALRPRGHDQQPGGLFDD